MKYENEEKYVAQTQTKTKTTEQLQETFLFRPFVRYQNFHNLQNRRSLPQPTRPGAFPPKDYFPKRKQSSPFTFSTRRLEPTPPKKEKKVFMWQPQRLKSHPVAA